jgi:hypothetical protein
LTFTIFIIPFGFCMALGIIRIKEWPSTFEGLVWRLRQPEKTCCVILICFDSERRKLGLRRHDTQKSDIIINNNFIAQ